MHVCMYSSFPLLCMCVCYVCMYVMYVCMYVCMHSYGYASADILIRGAVEGNFVQRLVITPLIETR